MACSEMLYVDETNVRFRPAENDWEVIVECAHRGTCGIYRYKLTHVAHNRQTRRVSEAASQAIEEMKEYCNTALAT